MIRINIYIDDITYKRLCEMSEFAGISRSLLIRLIINKYYKKIKKGAKNGKES